MFSQRFRIGSVSERKPRAPAVEPGGGGSEFADRDGREIPEGTPCKKFPGGDTPTRKRCCGTVGGRWGWLWCTSTTAWCTLEKFWCTRKFWPGTWAAQVGCPTSWSARGRAWSGPCLGPAPPALSIRAPVWVVRRTSLRERKVLGPSRVRAGVQARRQKRGVTRDAPRTFRSRLLVRLSTPKGARMQRAGGAGPRWGPVLACPRLSSRWTRRVWGGPQRKGWQKNPGRRSLREVPGG